MRVAIVVVTKDHGLRMFFEKVKGAVVPKQLLSNGVQYNIYLVDALSSKDELSSVLEIAHKRHDAVGALAEIGYENCLDDYFPAVFVKTFNPVEASTNPGNYFGHNLKRWLKNLFFLYRAFADGKQLKCLLLPCQSFDAPELDEIVRLCRMQNDEGQFQELIEAQLKLIRDRSIPKKKKSGERHFIKDDNDKYFELGKEKHGRSETRVPPHELKCNLTARARFGITVNRDLHYNVSIETGPISGQFEDCHSAPVEISARSHINMFPNGFVR